MSEVELDDGRFWEMVSDAWLEWWHGKREPTVLMVIEYGSLNAKDEEVESGVLYEILRDAGGTLAIRCRACGMVSWSEGDIREKYCGNCHRFLS